MLAPDEAEAVGSVTEAEFAQAEVDMLVAAGSRMLSLSDGSDANSQLAALRQELGAIAATAKGRTRSSVSRELRVAAAEHLEGEMEALGVSADVVSRLSGTARERTGATLLQAITRSQSLVDGMADDAAKSYVLNAYFAAAQARAGLMTGEEALEHAVAKMAADGVSCYTYQTKDGKTVRVPVDVGIRRVMGDAARAMYDSETQMVMQETGDDLVEVSSHPGARPSHAEWHGRVYSMSGTSKKYPSFKDACHVGDMVTGYGGYNCRHTYGIWREGWPRRYEEDPTPAGYTNDEVYWLRQKQRGHEDAIRRLKRQVTVMEANGIDATDKKRKIREHQSAIRELVSANQKVLQRDSRREQVIRTGNENRAVFDTSAPYVITNRMPNLVRGLDGGQGIEPISVRYAGRTYSQVILPYREYRMVETELNTNLRDDEKENVLVMRAIRNNVYTVLYFGTDDFIVIDKKSINSDMEVW